MKICERKGVNVKEEWNLLVKERRESLESEGEGESEADDDLELIDPSSMSILMEYRNKTEQLIKDLNEKETKLKLLQNECDSLVKISKEDTARLEEKSAEIQRLKRSNAKLQKENVDMKRDIRSNVGKEDSTPISKKSKAANIRSRQTLYVPSTQKLGLSAQRKQVKDTLLADFEPDEHKIDEIENNIFNKISESVDKIFNSQFNDTRTTFSGYKLESNDLFAGLDQPRMTISGPSKQRKRSIEDRFKEIAELPEEEERETKREVSNKSNANNKSTTFFFDDSSDGKSNSEDEGEPSNLHNYTFKMKEDTENNDDQKESSAKDTESTNNDEAKIKEYEDQEQKLIEEINILESEVQNEEEDEKDSSSVALDDHEDLESITDSNILDSHFDNHATEEDRLEDQQIQDELLSRQREVENLDGALLQKQELLEAIIESNKEMKKNIVDTMKQEYLKKIISLQNEIKLLESQQERDVKKAKTDASKTSVSNEYKQKIKQMEKELKILKKKDKEQVDKLRISKQQKEKIKTLSNEIDSIKTQKVKLQRQIKEEQEKHRQWKNEKSKAFMKMKRENAKKDQQITQLKRENTKKNNILRRKVEELKALQNRQKLENTKHRKALAQKQQLKKIDPEKIKKWVAENTQKLMKYQDIKDELEKENASKTQTENEIAEEQKNYGIIQTKKERLEVKRSGIDTDDQDAIDDIDLEIRALELELASITENMNSLEDKLDFVGEKISVFEKEIIEINPESIERLRFEEISNLEEAKVYLSSFFNIFLEMNVYRSMVENKILEQDEVIDNLRQEISDLNSKLQASEIKFREEIRKMHEKYKQKQDLIKEEMNEFMKIDFIAEMSNLDDYDTFNNNSPRRIKKEKSISDIGNMNGKQIRDEIKLRKQALRDVARVQATSKIGLSKMVTTLEKQTIEDEKKIAILKNKLSQAATEKQMFKQKYETLKAKVKTSETDDIKLIKTISLETREKYTKSPFRGGKERKEESKQQLKSLMQARKERKRAPLYTSRGNKTPIDMMENVEKKLNRTPIRAEKRKEHKPSFSLDRDDDAGPSNSRRSSKIITTQISDDTYAYTSDKPKTKIVFGS